MNPVLSMLGLALRGGRLAVGDEPAALAARAGECRLLLTASDAGGSVLRHAEHLAEAGHCLWLTIPFSKAELGGALGRGTAAVAAVTDLGLAAAVVKRLAALDPDAYGEAAERMELKVRRAAERKKTPRRKPPETAGRNRPRPARPPEGRGKRSEERRKDSPPGRSQRPPGKEGPDRGKPRAAEGRFSRKQTENRSRPSDRRGSSFHGSGRGPGRRSGGPGRGGGR
ncbi:MAG: 50S ribosomal protein L7 [Oscillibacter sp.]|nr:50S ribosomal protein L7 [Oscillibacter sp.]